MEEVIKLQERSILVGSAFSRELREWRILTYPSLGNPKEGVEEGEETGTEPEEPSLMGQLWMTVLAGNPKLLTLPPQFHACADNCLGMI